MRTTFHHRPVNGPFEDPLVYLRLLRQGRALLFDLGDISALPPRSMLKISDVFVTHTHIDHFIGFDTLLRTALRGEKPVRIYGPPNIIDCVQGKLGGYTWNLIEQYPLRLEVFAVDGETLRHASFHARNKFQRRDNPPAEFNGTVLVDEQFVVRAVTLEHDIQCLAYSIEEKFHINIDKAALNAMGLPVGPWLSELKAAIRAGAPEGTELPAGPERRQLGQLRHLAIITKGQKVTYVMDSAPTEENLEKIAALAAGSDTLYCEAYFMGAESQRALNRRHLTARHAGAVARRAGAKNLVVLHFSAKYKADDVSPAAEADSIFRGE